MLENGEHDISWEIDGCLESGMWINAGKRHRQETELYGSPSGHN